MFINYKIIFYIKIKSFQISLNNFTHFIKIPSVFSRSSSTSDDVEKTRDFFTKDLLIFFLEITFIRHLREILIYKPKTCLFLFYHEEKS